MGGDLESMIIGSQSYLRNEQMSGQKGGQKGGQESYYNRRSGTP